MSLTVLALHGLASTGTVWQPLAAALPDARLVAPDLAGRGDSVGRVVAPGLAGHAQDVVAEADRLGLDDVVVVGHSMGAFLAPLVAAALGERVRRVVLVDGGVPPQLSVLMVRPVLRTVFGIQSRLVNRRWNSPEEFAEKIEGRAVTQRPELKPALVDWARHLLGPDGRPRLDSRRFVADAIDTLTGPSTLDALSGSTVPVHLIAAAHGANDRARPFLSEAALAPARAALPRLTVERVDANHVTILFDPALPKAVVGG